MGGSVPVLLAIALLPGIAQTNKTEPRRVRRDGTAQITVSAGIPKEQLKIEADCIAKLEDGKSYLAADPQRAIPLLQQALELAEKHDYLRLRRSEALESLGEAQAVLGNAIEAIKAFRQRLQFYGEPCEQDSREPAACGEAEIEEASAAWWKGGAASTASALVLARAARADFRRQQELDKSDAAIASHRASEARALLFESVVLAASGRWDPARSAADDAVVLLKQVLSAGVPVNIRGKAVKDLDWANEMLKEIGARQTTEGASGPAAPP
jgi:tetratricopeptide (TPR) repeat protein